MTGALDGGQKVRRLQASRVSFQGGGEAHGCIASDVLASTYSWAPGKFGNGTLSEKHTSLHIWWKEPCALVECILYYVHILFYLWAQPCCKRLQIGKPSVQ